MRKPLFVLFLLYLVVSATQMNVNFASSSEQPFRAVDEIICNQYEVTPKSYDSESVSIADEVFFWGFRKHFLEGSGEDVILTKEQFDALLGHGRIDFSTAELIDDEYFVANVSFYESDLDLHLSFGVSTVKFKIENGKIEFFAFRDTYNFDPKPWGERGVVNELIVRTYDKLSEGRQFGIYYNKTLF